MMNPIRNIERFPGPGGPRTHHNYPMERRRALRFQEGGEADPADLQEPDDNLSPHDQEMKQVVVDAMAAIRGENPHPEEAVQRFIELFGEEDFKELRQMVLQGGSPDDEEEEDDEPEDDGEGDPEELQAQQPGMQVGGLLRGPGTGQSDEIEATTPSGRRVLLSDGEYVIDAPTVAAIGDGSTSAGARRLDDMRKEIRRQAYGHDRQAKPMRKGGLLETLK